MNGTCVGKLAASCCMFKNAGELLIWPKVSDDGDGIVIENLQQHQPQIHRFNKWSLQSLHILHVLHIFIFSNPPSLGGWRGNCLMILIGISDQETVRKHQKLLRSDQLTMIIMIRMLILLIIMIIMIIMILLVMMAMMVMMVVFIMLILFTSGYDMRLSPKRHLADLVDLFAVVPVVSTSFLILWPRTIRAQPSLISLDILNILHMAQARQLFTKAICNCSSALAKQWLHDLHACVLLILLFYLFCLKYIIWCYCKELITSLIFLVPPRADGHGSVLIVLEFLIFLEKY